MILGDTTGVNNSNSIGLNIKRFLSDLLMLMRFTIACFIMIIAESISKFVKWFVEEPRSLKGQVVLVTGSGNGLGRELAFQFAKNGCKLACVDFDKVSNEKVVTSINEKYPNCAKAYQTNVGKVKDIENLAKQVEADWQHVDILINNAGIIPVSGTIVQLMDDNIEAVIQVNLLSHFRMVRQFLPAMIERNDGHIVAISSLSAFTGLAKASHYVASKWGINGFMATLHEELTQIPKNRIKTTTVCPYFINTNPVYRNHWNLRIPALPVEYVAEEIIKAIRNDEVLLSLPRYLYYVVHWIKFWPQRLADYFRDTFYTKIRDASEEQIEEYKRILPTEEITNDLKR